MATDFSIRNARLPEDEAAMIAFIDASQAFEHAFEPDRRIDANAGADYLPVLVKKARDNKGSILAAESAGRPVGWAVFRTAENMVFVIAEERTFGYIDELFVAEEFRGQGIGRALIAACEEAARALKLKVIMLGAAAGNMRARRIYEEAGYAPYAMDLRKYL